MNSKLWASAFAALALAACTSTTALAQDVIVNFKTEGQLTGAIETIAKGDNVEFTFSGDATGKRGVYINGLMPTAYYLTVSAPKGIAVIEYEIETPYAGKTTNVKVTAGSSPQQGADGIWVWRGAANSIKFTGVSSDDKFCITRLRLWFDAKDYNHDTAVWDTEGGGGTGGGEETRPYQADVDLTNDATDYTEKDRVYASVNILPRDGHGVPMAVVSDRKFQQTLQPYLEWKTQQGYEVQELYTDQVPSGLGRQEMALALRQRLMEMKPRPAYVLLVGDSQEVPVFYGKTYDANHASDCYYGEYTDDHFVDAYVGRYSASTPAELQWQLDKTKHMALITPAEGDWLKHSITVNNVSSDIIAMKEAVSLSKNYPLNFAGNVTEEMEASWTSTINKNINNGCSFVSYFGHGSTNSWNNGYTSYYADQLANKGRYPLVLSMTCLSGTFDGIDCLAEAFMRKEEAGAVAVIAASRNSMANDNNYIFRGNDSSGKSASIGLLRSLFPYVGSDPSQRARTIGQAMDVGMIAVMRSILADYNSASEMYNLFGDPTYQPYITTPKANKLSASSYNIIAGHNVTVTTAPDAMVCLSKGRNIIAAVMADAKGKAVIHVPASTTLSGECTLYSSAPGYNDLSRKVTLSAGNGTDELLDGQGKAQPAVTHTDVISLATVGSSVGDNWPDAQQRFNGKSSTAQYAIRAATEKALFKSPQMHWVTNSEGPSEGIYLRNNYDPCSLITTRSGGKARTVSIEWLYPTGQGEVIGVYGSNTAYSSTNDAWESGRQGTKLGELVKGVNNTLPIDGNYTYLLFRAENHKEYPRNEQSDVFIKQLSIDWEAELPQCATPQITFEGGQFQFHCATSGASFRYGISPSATDNNSFVLTVTAEAPGYAPSKQASHSIGRSELVKTHGDIDENGTISITDLTKLIDSLIKNQK